MMKAGEYVERGGDLDGAQRGASRATAEGLMSEIQSPPRTVLVRGTRSDSRGEQYTPRAVNRRPCGGRTASDGGHDTPQWQRDCSSVQTAIRT
jgi:hypothetical protein